MLQSKAGGLATFEDQGLQVRSEEGEPEHAALVRYRRSGMQHDLGRCGARCAAGLGEQPVSVL